MGAIGLNPIRLDAIGLDPIRINAIKLGVPGASSATDRPYISPDVLSSLAGVWIADGKSNTDPDRNIIKNKLPGRGGDFEIFNAAYKLNSGFGKYAEDFSTMKDYGTKGIVRTSSKIYLDESFDYDKGFWLGYTNSPSPTYKVRVSGIPKDGVLNYTGGSWINLINGINELPARTNTEEIHGFVAQTPNVDWSKLVIEQIPEYEGSFVTDGVNDMIVSQNPVSEMLGGSKELTVVSMIHQITAGSNVEGKGFTNYIRTSDNNWISNRISNIDKTGIYGYSLKQSVITVINNILGDKNDYTTENAGDFYESLRANFSVEGFKHTTLGTVHTTSVAWYWTFIAKRVLTTDEINQVIAYYNLDKYVKPDILCDVKRQGITNENHAEFGDKLIDYSGNGRDIQLNNISWNKESGINDDGALRLDGVTDYGKAVGLPIYKDYTFIIDREIISIGDVLGVVASKSENSTRYGAFIFECLTAPNKISTWSFYKENRLVANTDFTRGISYQSTYSYNGKKDLTIGTSEDSDKLWIGTIRTNDFRFFNGAIYSLMSFPYSMSGFLIERQLKKHKLGTLYPGMVEFRPIVKSNIPYSSISYSVNPGEYVAEGSTVTITITLSNSSDKLVDISSNAISDISISGDNGIYEVTGKITKSPQKINIVISSYLTMLDNETLISNETLIKNE